MTMFNREYQSRIPEESTGIPKESKESELSTSDYYSEDLEEALGLDRDDSQEEIPLKTMVFGRREESCITKFKETNNLSLYGMRKLIDK